MADGIIALLLTTKDMLMVGYRKINRCIMNEINEELVTRTGLPRQLTRWWLKVRQIEPIRTDDGLIHAMSEFYVPFWAWPFELLHRMVFGSTKITSIK